MKKSRRQFIKSGSLFLALPFIDALPSMSFAANASGSLKRVLFFNLSQSWCQDQAFPTATNYMVGPEGVRYIPLSSFSGDISKLFTASKYGSIKGKMNIMRGFDCIGPATGGGGHNKGLAMSAWFENGTQMPLKTIDHTIADAPGFYPVVPHRKVFSAIAAKGNYSWRYSNSFNLTKPIPDLIAAGACYTNAEGTKEIFADLFSTALPVTGGTATPVDSSLSRRAALNSALGKLNILSKNSKLSKESQLALAQHADFINQVLPTIAPPAAPTTSLGSCAKPTLDNSINDSELSTSGNGKRLRACMDMIYMAFSCQLTNVVAFHPMIAADNENAAMRDDVGIYHENVGHKYNPNYYLSHKGFLFDQLLYLVNMMESTKESNGLSMLDNSLVVVVSDDGCATHSHQDMGVVTFGSLGGTIKTGNFINYQRTDSPIFSNGSDNGRYDMSLGRPYNSFFTTILNALKIQNSGYGLFPSSSANYAQFLTAAAKAASLPVLT